MDDVMNRLRGYLDPRALLVAGLVVGAGMLAGCQQAMAPTGPAGPATTAQHALIDPPVADDVELADHVYWLDVGRVHRLTLDADTMTFAAPVPGDVAGLHRGDILVSSAGAGFWRAIESIERTPDALILHTREAQLGEVVKNGSFSYEWTPEDHADDETSQTRASALATCLLCPHKILRPNSAEGLGTLELSTDMGNSARADVSNANLSVDTLRGGVSFRPAVRLKFDVFGNVVFHRSFQVSGFATADALWDVNAQGASSLRKGRRLLPGAWDPNAQPGGLQVMRQSLASDPPVSLSFQLVGRTFTINPDIRLLYDVSATAAGDAQFGLHGSGYVLAGYDCRFNLCKALQPAAALTPFTAQEIHQYGSGEPNINFRAALRVGVKLLDQGGADGGATPLSLNFESHAEVTPPFCPYNATSTVSGESTFSGQEFSSYSRKLFDVYQIFTGEHQCGVINGDTDDASDLPCVADGDCQEGEICMLGSNHCAEEHPLMVTLKWSQDVDLDLRVETPSGEMLSADTPIISNGQLTHLSSGGTNCDSCVGQCTGGVAVDCPNTTPTDGTCPDVCEYHHDSGSCQGHTFKLCKNLDADARLCSAVDGCKTLFLDDKLHHGIRRCIGFHRQSCDIFDTQSMCENNRGCTWQASSNEWCDGATVQCSDLDQTACTDNTACTWQSAQGEIPPYIEHAALDVHPQNQTFRIWVVNVSGTQDETVDYELFFRAQGHQPFQMQGHFEPQADSQSVFFDYTFAPPSN